MTPLSVLTLVCTLCVAGIGAIYFVWVRERSHGKEPAQPETK